MLNALNHTQLEILKLLHFLKVDKDLAEIKSLRLSYLSDKVVRPADKAFDEKYYTSSVFKKWKQENFFVNQPENEGSTRLQYF